MKGTYQTRIKGYAGISRSAGDGALGACAELYGQVQRKLFAKMAAGYSAALLKSEYLKRFGISARFFNAVRISLQGKVASVRESQKLCLDDLRRRIARAKRQIAKAEKRGRPDQVHHKRRRLVTLVYRLMVLKAELKAGLVRLCFGSKKLWHKQFHLAENGYASHEAWLEDWQQARSDEFFLLGSKDEMSGCQLCVAAVADDGSLTLRLRMPDALAEEHGKYVTVTGVRFAYGHEQVLAALGAEQAISYRFKRDTKGWRVFATTEVQDVPVVTDKRRGAVGVDLNADHLAVAETDASGNYVCAFRISLVTYGKSRRQAEALIGDAVARVVEHAKCAGKPIVIERLDFRKKKAALEGQSRKYSRMLCSFSYGKTLACFMSRGQRQGVAIHQVNPAYSSVIGRVKFMTRYGLSSHQSAALVLARRLLGCSERIPRRRVCPADSGVPVTFRVPARKHAKHVWTYWGAILGQLRPALATQYRLGKSRDGPNPIQAFVRALAGRDSLSGDQLGVSGCDSRAEPS